MIQHHTRLTRLARQAMRRGDAAGAAHWIRTAALVRPAAAKAEKPTTIDPDNQIDEYAEERARVTAQLEGLLARLEREAAEQQWETPAGPPEADPC